jgi:hypothetical protein
MKILWKLPNNVFYNKLSRYLLPIEYQLYSKLNTVSVISHDMIFFRKKFMNSNSAHTSDLLACANFVARLMFPSNTTKSLYIATPKKETSELA